MAHQALPARAAALFAAMPVADRRHALDVAHGLTSAGIDDHDLIAAALLHDAAKGHGMRLVHRVGGVLLENFAPGVLRRLAAADQTSWRHPFHLYLHHGPMSADLAERAGCSPRAVGFIRGVATPNDERLMRALKAVDDRA